MNKSMKTTVHFEVVNVQSRLEDGRLGAWYPGDKLVSLREARAAAVKLRKEYPDAEFEVVRIKMDQIPEAAAAARAKKAKEKK